MPGFISPLASRVWQRTLALHSGRLHATFPHLLLVDDGVSTIAPVALIER
ncbi:MAG: hypothetical protein WB804_12950 [Candidatus Dormiibacterota bacterium]